MRMVMGLAVGMIVCISAATQAAELNKKDRYLCEWGSGMAGVAQQSKLSGISLYGARSKLQNRKFSQPWMRMMAMGITEQTYSSSSRMKPAEIKRTYYQDCIRHELARR